MKIQAFHYFEIVFKRALTYSVMAVASLFSALVSDAAELKDMNDPMAQARYMARKLDAYHQGGSVDGGKPVRVIYFHSLDREPFKDYQSRVADIMFDIQDFFGEQMGVNGFPNRSLKLETAEGQLKLHVVRGKLKDADYNYHSGGEILKEVTAVMKKSGIDLSEEYVIVFCALADVDGRKIHLRAPFYGMGANHVYGRCLVADCEWLSVDGFTDKKTKLSVGEHGKARRMTLGEFNTIYIGGTAHELGHGLSLPHNKATDALARERGTALQGAGNYTYRQELRNKGKGSFLTPGHAMRLASLPMFSRSTKGMVDDVKFELEHCSARFVNGGLEVSGKVQCHPEAYAVVAYNDPVGGSDYDARTWTSIVNDPGEFKVRIGDLMQGSYELRLSVCHLNGAVSTHAIAYSSDQDGIPDLDRINLYFQMEKAVDAYVRGEKGAAVVLAKEALKQNASNEYLVERMTHLMELCEDRKDLIGPKRVSEDQSMVYLADCEWTNAVVGWCKPRRNEYARESSDDKRIFIEIGNTFHAKGLYAHSPSNYTFDLGGKWAQLSASYGLQVSGEGAVVFGVKGDGRELFRSPSIKSSQERSVMLDVAGVNTLELIVENGGDHKGRCWSVWGSPKLMRK